MFKFQEKRFSDHAHKLAEQLQDDLDRHGEVDLAVELSRLRDEPAA